MENFNDIIKSGKLTLVDFYATWCGPCKMLAPIMEEVSKTNTVYKMDTDNNMDLAQEFGIMSIPCVILFKDGKEVKRSVGLVSKEDIEAMKNQETNSFFVL